MKTDGFVSAQLQFIEQFRTRPILANPYGFVEVLEQDLQRSLDQMRNKLDTQLGQAELQLVHLRQQVRSLSPQSTLDRGYSVVRDEQGHVLTDSKKIKAGQKLNIRLAKGDLGATAN
jgi:exodeoxyribonuclease VII large subunit